MTVYVISSPKQFGISLGEAEHFVISNNSIQGILSTGAVAVDIGTTFLESTGIVAHNDIFGFTNGGSGVILSASSTSVLVSGNVFVVVDTPITDAGSDNRVIDNLGYNPVGVQTLSVGPSPFTFSGANSPETHYIVGIPLPVTA